MKTSIFEVFADDAIDGPAALTGGARKRRNRSRSGRSRSRS